MAGFEFDPVSYAMGRIAGKSATIIPLSVTANGEYTPGDGMGYAPVTVDVQTGGVSKWGDVNYIDYDGTLICSYSADEFAQLSDAPAAPTHSGLTAQSWNYTFNQAKNYTLMHGRCDVGQSYISSDGLTHIYIKIEAPRLSPTLSVQVNGQAELDWGDGSDPVDLTGNGVLSDTHTYSEAGEYDVTLEVISGSITIVGTQSAGSSLLSRGLSSASNYVYQGAVTDVAIGSQCMIGDWAFANCHSLRTVNVPYGTVAIGNGAFYYCTGLKSIVLPSGLMNLGTHAFLGCFSLEHAVFGPGIYAIGERAFYQCSSLAGMTMPETVTGVGDEAFYGCAAMKYVTSSDEFNHYGSYAFSECRSLESITLDNWATATGQYAFLNCYNLRDAVLSDDLETINDSSFSGCFSMKTLTIGDSVKQIGPNAFNSCASLAALTVPASVTSIGAGAFLGCYGLGEVHFDGATPPAVASSSAFTGLPTDCVIYVPTGKLSAYTGATNYPSSATYTYTEE